MAKQSNLNDINDSLIAHFNAPDLSQMIIMNSVGRLRLKYRTRKLNTSIWYQLIKKIINVRAMEARHSSNPIGELETSSKSRKMVT